MKTEDKILAAQTALLWDHPFFGVLMLQLKKVQVDDPKRSIRWRQTAVISSTTRPSSMS